MYQTEYVYVGNYNKVMHVKITEKNTAIYSYIHLISVELERKDLLRLLQSSSCECLDLPIATFFSGLEVVVIDTL